MSPPYIVRRIALTSFAIAFAASIASQSNATTSSGADSAPSNLALPTVESNTKVIEKSTASTVTTTVASKAEPSATTQTLEKTPSLVEAAKTPAAPVGAPTIVNATTAATSPPAATSIVNSASTPLVPSVPSATASEPANNDLKTETKLPLVVTAGDAPAATVPPPTLNEAPFQAIEAPPTDLWDRIRAGFTMVDLEDELVVKWEKYYADRPDYVARIVDRSSKYMFYIVTELERRNLPLEIALLPMIESAFNPVAHSSAKASGIWQFIPSTGTQFGMKQDWWADSRRDIVAATNGALDYLTKLHGMFGDWQLALASYNWGEGSVMRASSRAKAAGRDGTYLTLSMPAETRNYLPKLQAVKNIIRNPAAYGLTIASVPNEPYFKTITLAHAIDLKKAAQLASMSEAEFVALNPAHNRPVIAGRGDFQILLPADKAEQFLARLEADERPRVSWRAYKTKQGDRIEAIAQRFGITAEVIRSVNGIRAMSPVLPAGYNILVPADGPSDEALGSIQNAVFTKFPESSGSSSRAHRVRKGETLAGIAKRYGVAASTLAKWNRLNKQTVRAGQTIYVNGPAPTRSQAKTVRASYKKSGGKSVKVQKSAKKSKQASKAKKR